MGPTVTGPVQDPLAVLFLDNRLYIPEKCNNLKNSFQFNIDPLPPLWHLPQQMRKLHFWCYFLKNLGVKALLN